MSKYFVVPKEGVGPGGDIVFRKHGGPYPGWYNLFVGGVQLGLVIDSGRGLWEAQSYGPHPNEWFGEINGMDGFGTRYAAAQFIIKHHGYWLHNERDRKADRERWAVRLAEIVSGKAAQGE